MRLFVAALLGVARCQDTSGVIELVDYADYSDETWTIEAPCSEVLIQSTHFDTEPNYDALYINGEGPFFGYDQQDYINAEYSTPVTITFTSDGSVTASGFHLTWMCAGIQTGSGGVIQVYDYDNDHDQSWTIQSDCLTQVHVRSVTFDTEECCDHVTIDGVQYSGSGVVVDQVVPVNFDVSFTTDGSITNTGFELVWSCSSPTEQNGTSGSIQMGEYENSQQMAWTIDADCGDVLVASSHFDTESGYDHVTVDGTSYSGSDVSIEQIVPANFVVSFSADGSNTATGFTLTWSCNTPAFTGFPTEGVIELIAPGNDHDQDWHVLTACDSGVHIVSESFSTEGCCDHVTIDSTEYSGDAVVSHYTTANFTVNFSSDGSVTSTGFRLYWSCGTSPVQTGSSGAFELGHYDNNHDITWTVDSDCDGGIHVYSTYFHTESSYDQVTIGENSYSGEDAVVDLEMPNEFTVTFTSDGSVTYTGFNINWECIPPLTEGIIELYSPGNDHDQDWHVDSACGAGVHIISESFETEGCCDHVTIEGEEYSGNAVISQYVGVNFTVNFSSDGSVTSTGFRLYWSCGTSPVQTGSSGAFELGHYDNNHDITWTVDSDCLYGVHVFSTYFDTESSYDEVTIGENVFSGSGVEFDLAMPAAFDVVFTSDGSITRTGFNIQWECVVPLTSGVIELIAPGNDHDESWNVASDCRHGVHIISESFSTEGCCDHVTIDGSEYSGDAVISQYVPWNFTVSFSSDGSVTSTGFRLLWSCGTSPEQSGTSGVIELGHYDNDHDMTWSVNSECSEVRIYSTHFNTESYYDTVSVGENVFSGDNDAMVDLVMPASFDVNFNSDGSITRTGFTLIWFCYIPPQTGLSGVIELFDYENDHDMEWSVQSECASVHIYSESFSTEGCCDHVTIEGISHSGYNAEIDQYVGQNFTVAFSSDYSITSTGFRLHWYCGSPTYQTGSEGVIQLSEYDNDHDITWTIDSVCYDIHIYSASFDTESTYDTVTIGESSFSGSDVEVDMIMPGTFDVRFTSDGSVTQTGFVLWWSCRRVESGTFGVIELLAPGNDHDELWNVASECSSGVHIISDLFSTEGCCDHVTIEGEEYSGDAVISQYVGVNFTVSFTSDGSVTSTGFRLLWSCGTSPEQTGVSGMIELGHYDNDHDMTWSVNSDCDQVRIFSTYFDTESGYDYVTIGDSEQFSGSNTVVDLVMPSSFEVNFNSDYSVTRTGFTLWWMCYSAPQSGISGIIELENYDNNHDQRWDVHSDCAGGVHIISEAFSTEGCCDHVTIEGQHYSGYSGVSVSQFVPPSFSVIFSSDYSITSTGFRLLWSCGTPSEQTGTSGFIELGHYDNYQDLSWSVNSDCDEVHIYSMRFDTEGGYDYVNIGDATFSGSNQVVNLVMPAAFDVTFHSDYSVTRTGFSLAWQCFGTPNPNAISGIIQLFDYQNDHDQTWQVDSACGNGVRIVSESFSTEGCCDHVTIEGSEYSGAAVVDQVVDSNFTVYFSSDFSVTSSGFRLLWSCFVDSDNVEGTISYAANVTATDELVWDVQADCPNGVRIAGNVHSGTVMINGHEFDYFNSSYYYYDYYSYYYQYDDYHTAHIAESNFTVVATMDESDGIWLDFSLDWHCDPLLIHQTGSAGRIQLSPYGNDHSVRWVIDSDCSNGVWVTSEFFDVESNYDYLEINGSRFDGNMEINMYVGNHFVATFESDYVISDGTHAGFMVNWMCIPTTTTSTTSTTSSTTTSTTTSMYSTTTATTTSSTSYTHTYPTHSSTSGPTTTEYTTYPTSTTTSYTGGPHPEPEFYTQYGVEGIIELTDYENHHDVHWDIYSDCRQIHVVSEFFHTEGCCDHLTIEGVEYSGAEVFINQIIDHSDFSADFQSDYSVTETGFRVHWFCYVPVEEQYGVSGVIELTNYDNDYDHEWHIASECEQIHVVSEFFDTEGCCDHLNIGDNEYNGDDVIDIIIDGSGFVAVFSSDGSITSTGFRIHWSCYVGTIHQTGSYGVLELGEYDNDHDIEWHIDSDCASIHLVSTHFDTEGCCDHLTIAGQEYSGAAVINQVVEGSSFVATFISDGSITGTGFTVLWSCYVPVQPTPEPGMNCDTYGFCLMRGPAPAKWHEARNFCEAHNMALPHPRHEMANAMYHNAGTTWLAMNINDMLNEYDNSYKNFIRRQRGWLNENGRWASRQKDLNLDFFCVEKERGCDNFFQEWMFEEGTWLEMQRDEQFDQFHDNMAYAMDDISVGTIYNFRCSNDWDRTTDASFRCIRGEESALMVRCTTRRCSQFDRLPYQFEDHRDVFTCN